MRVLLAVDGSACSHAAAESVAKRNWPAGTAVDVITVIEPYTEPMLPGPYADYAVHHRLTYEGLKREAQRLVDDVAQRLRSTASIHEAVPHVIAGHPVDTIMSAASRLQSDMIVVGSHGKGAVSRLLLGSVSHSVVLHAPCSVEVVKPPASGNGPFNVLIPMDFSEPAKCALARVKELSPVERIHIRLLVVLPPPVQLLAGIEVSGTEALSIIEESDSAKTKASLASAELSDELALRFGQDSVSVQVSEGDPRTVILDVAESWPASLIVMGSRGHTGLRRMLLGSVAQSIVLHAPCSVQVVKPLETAV